MEAGGAGAGSGMRRWAWILGVVTAGGAMAAPPDPPADPVAADAIRLIQQGRSALSVPMLEEVLARRPGDPDLLTYLALALRMEGRREEAATRYEQALDRDAAHLPALAYQGVLFLQMGDRRRAEANLARLVALCPQGCPEREDLRRELAR